MVTMTPELIEMTREARIIHYIRRLRRDLSPDQVMVLVTSRFEALPSSFSMEWVTGIVQTRTLKRHRKATTPNQIKANDSEVKEFIRSFAASGEKGRVVRDFVAERFGLDRTPGLSTITVLLAEARRKAGLPPKRGPYGRPPPKPGKSPKGGKSAPRRVTKPRK